MGHSKIFFLILLLAGGFCSIASAKPLWTESNQVYMSQLDNTDAYDPFVDYSEFEEASEEEADINFFRNGRFFTLGGQLGSRAFTDQLGQITGPNFSYGLFLSYFFDLRFAVQLGFNTSDHDFKVKTSAAPIKTFTGNVGITNLNIHLKYYFNTQNVTKGLAQFNPYVIGGFSQVTRKSTIGQVSSVDIDIPNEDSATSFDIGAGMEIPIMRKKMYVGVQSIYQLVTFPDEGTELRTEGNEATGVFPKGDMFNFTVILGVNF